MFCWEFYRPAQAYLSGLLMSPERAMWNMRGRVRERQEDEAEEEIKKEREAGNSGGWEGGIGTERTRGKKRQKIINILHLYAQATWHLLQITVRFIGERLTPFPRGWECFRTKWMGWDGGMAQWGIYMPKWRSNEPRSWRVCSLADCISLSERMFSNKANTDRYSSVSEPDCWDCFKFHLALLFTSL